MAIDGKTILKRLEAAKKGDRDRVTLYLSKSVYESFKSKCGDIPVSVVLEELLREFVATAPESKQKSKK
jgi:hypothetical protein